MAGAEATAEVGAVVDLAAADLVVAAGPVGLADLAAAARAAAELAAVGRNGVKNDGSGKTDC